MILKSNYLNTHFTKLACAVLLASLSATTLSACSNPAHNETAETTDTAEVTNTTDSVDTTSETQTSVTEDADTPSLDAQQAGNVTIATNKGDVTLPVNPRPIAVYDMTVMQDLTALGVPMDGTIGDPLLESLIMSGATPQIVGTVFEPDLEALNALNPPAIFSGGRMAEKYADLEQIAPTLDLSLDEGDMYNSSKDLLAKLGKLFGKTDKANDLQADIDNAIADAKSVTAGKGNGLVILVNGNKLSAQGASSRFSFVHKQFGVPMADESIEDAKHGQPVSFEYIQKVNPDWLFVLDRTSAIGEEGEGAKQVLDNELMHQTKAWQNDHIVYLSPDSYLAYGGYNQWMTDANSVIEAFSKAD